MYTNMMENICRKMNALYWMWWNEETATQNRWYAFGVKSSKLKISKQGSTLKPTSISSNKLFKDNGYMLQATSNKNTMQQRRQWRWNMFVELIWSNLNFNKYLLLNWCNQVISLENSKGMNYSWVVWLMVDG